MVARPIRKAERTLPIGNSSWGNAALGLDSLWSLGVVA